MYSITSGLKIEIHPKTSKVAGCFQDARDLEQTRLPGILMEGSSKVAGSILRYDSDRWHIWFGACWTCYIDKVGGGIVFGLRLPGSNENCV